MFKKQLIQTVKQFLLYFQQVTHFAERVGLDIQILSKKKLDIYLTKIKILPTEIKTTFSEYKFKDFLIIIIFFVLILWIYLQARYHGSQFYINYFDYEKIQKLLEETEQTQIFLDDVLQGQQAKLDEMSYKINTTSYFLLIAYFLGFGTYAFMMAYVLTK